MGCVKLHILDQQYKYTELKVSYINKKLTLKNSATNQRKEILVMFVDPDGREIVYGEDIFLYKDGKVERLQTGDNTPNRLFVQDENANANTPNRLEYNGGYFQRQMIPKDAYSDEHFEENDPLGFWGKGTSQFEKDRTDYVGYAGKYSDKNFLERTWESLKDEGFVEKSIELGLLLVNRGKVGKLSNSFRKTTRKGERNLTAKPDGTNNPFKKMKPDPTNSKQVIMKDSNGKTIKRAKPPGFDEYWNKKH